MSLFDAFRYDGKRAVVVGAATGMGHAVARLVKDAGAEVVATAGRPACAAWPGDDALRSCGRRRYPAADRVEHEPPPYAIAAALIEVRRPRA